ncbi:WSC domain-containing protein 1-like [Homarus americanus]|uniref:WSC domain-containing protein 1-like n=1 Tax=Homarus americanus TaxID=6706 RepID=UPI001C46AB87|nr:WSC domain-containing protein 1-like [Homarus americanus]
MFTISNVHLIFTKGKLHCSYALDHGRKSKMAVDRGNVLLATTFFCVLMLQHYLQELPFGCSPSPCNDSTHTVSSRPSVHDHHPHAGRCEGRGQEGDVLTGALHQRVVRRAGDNLRVNMTGPSWQPWREDDPGSPCVNYETRLGGGMARVWLVSFPCSGNTWTRYLLEAVTGIFTGSFYNDDFLYKSGMLGEEEKVDSGRTLVQKIHGAMMKTTYPYDLLIRHSFFDHRLPTILLLRNPARAIISYWKLLILQDRGGHTGDLPPEQFLSKDFHDFVETYVSHWEVIATDRLLWSSGPLYVLHYEHLLHNTTHHLRHLLHFLRVPVNEDRLACVSSHLTGPFKRSSNKDFDPFTTQEKIIMSTVVRRVTRLLLLLDYPPPPVYEWLS